MRTNRAGQRRGLMALGLLLLILAWLAGCGGIVQPGAVPRTPAPAATKAVEKEVVVTKEVVEPTQAPIMPVPEETTAPTVAPTPDVAMLAQAEFERMSRGNILYNPPTQMRLGQRELVEVRIGSEEVSAEALAENLQGSGAPVIEAVVVASFMKVRLVGDGFDIAPLSSEEQFVSGNSYTQWAWDVTPRKSGDQSLDLIVTARIKLSGYSDEQKDLCIIRRHIAVQVDAGYALASFLEGNGDWLFPSVIIPVVGAAGGLIWRRMRKRRGAPTSAEHKS